MRASGAHPPIREATLLPGRVQVDGLTRGERATGKQDVVGLVLIFDVEGELADLTLPVEVAGHVEMLAMIRLQNPQQADQAVDLGRLKSKVDVQHSIYDLLDDDAHETEW